MKAERPLAVVFFRTEAGNEPVREWLKALSKESRKTIGEDILTIQVRLAGRETLSRQSWRRDLGNTISLKGHHRKDALFGYRPGNSSTACVYQEIPEDS